MMLHKDQRHIGTHGNWEITRNVTHWQKWYVDTSQWKWHTDTNGKLTAHQRCICTTFKAAPDVIWYAPSQTRARTSQNGNDTKKLLVYNVTECYQFERLQHTTLHASLAIRGQHVWLECRDIITKPWMIGRHSAELRRWHSVETTQEDGFDRRRCTLWRLRSCRRNAAVHGTVVQTRLPVSTHQHTTHVLTELNNKVLIS